MRVLLSLLASSLLCLNALPANGTPDGSAFASVKSCQVVPGAVARGGAGAQEVIRVSFAVDRAVAADVARFTVATSNGTFRSFTTRGRFSPGTLIADRVLRADPSSQQRFYSLGSGAAAQCALTYLHFVDGTAWIPGLPVHVAACRVIPNKITQRSSTQQLIRVSFALEEGPPADIARFTVKTANGDYEGFTARGTLSGGTAIADRLVWANPEAQRQFDALGSSVGCEVSYVHFIDGTSWSAASP